MSTGLLDIMKRASLDAFENSKPCDLRYGKVISISPLKIQVTQHFIIPESILIVPEHLTDYEVDVTIDWKTESAGLHNHPYTGTTDSAASESGESHSHGVSGTTDSNGTHLHDIVGRKPMIVHGALRVGDKVALLRQAGGQHFLVLDRI